jgi:hypothetical protein
MNYLASLRYLRWAQTLLRSNGFEAFMVAYLLARHFSASDILLLAGLRQLLGALLPVPTGMFADHCGRKLSLMIGGSGCFGSMAIFSLSANWACIVTASLVGWAGKDFFNGADNAVAGNLVYAENRHSDWRSRFSDYNVHQARQIGLGEAVTCIAATCIAMWFGLYAVIIAQGIVYLVTLVLILAIKEPPPDTCEPCLGSHGDPISHSSRLIRLAAYLIAIGAINSMSGLAYRMVPMSYGAVRYHGAALPTAGFGWIWAGYLASQWLIGLSWRPFHLDRIGIKGSIVGLAGLALLGGICYGVLGAVHSVVGLVAIFGLSVMRALEGGLSTKLFVDVTKRESQATAASTSSMVQNAVGAATMLLAGWIIRSHGLGAGLVICGLIPAGITGLALAILAYQYSSHRRM